MTAWWWALCWLATGFALGVMAMIVMQEIASDRAAARRARKRAVLGLPDRDAQRPGSIGNARIHTSEYLERDPEHGMQQ